MRYYEYMLRENEKPKPNIGDIVHFTHCGNDASGEVLNVTVDGVEIFSLNSERTFLYMGEIKQLEKKVFNLDRPAFFTAKDIKRYWSEDSAEYTPISVTSGTETKKPSTEGGPKDEHYKEGDIECVDYLWDNLTMEKFIGGLEWNVKKYLHRWSFKGEPVKDLRKARDYLNVLIDVMEGKDPKFKEWK
jgi:hypothetical protein